MGVLAIKIQEVCGYVEFDGLVAAGFASLSISYNLRLLFLQPFHLNSVLLLGATQVSLATLVLAHATGTWHLGSDRCHSAGQKAPTISAQVFHEKNGLVGLLWFARGLVLVVCPHGAT